MREHDDGGVAVRSQLLQRFVRPGDDELVRARQPLASGERRPRVGNGCTPAEALRGATELLGGVDRADDQQARRRPEHLREDRLAAELDHAARPRLDRVRPGHAPLAGPLAFENRQSDRGLARLGQLALEALDEDVDLPTARQADIPGHVVGDPVGEQPRLAVLDHLGGLDGDVALDTTAGNGAEELTALRDRKLGANRPRRGTARRDHGRQGDPVAPGPPALDAFRELSHARRVSVRRRGAAAGRTRG